jgi:hypothetical protein
MHLMTRSATGTTMRLSAAGQADARLSSEGELMATRRTTMRSRTGTKLYAVRDSSGKFKDIQSYKRAHAADMRKTSKAEAATAGKKTVTAKVAKAAKKASKAVRSQVGKAVAAVKRAAKKMSAVARSSRPKAAVAKKAVKKAAKKVAEKVAKKPAAKKSTGK